jgi:hypothetical protein
MCITNSGGSNHSIVFPQEKNPMNRIPKIFWVLLIGGLVLSSAAPALAGEMQGKIKSVDADLLQFVLADNKGGAVTFQMDEDAQVVINDREANLADLRPGDQVIVIHRASGNDMMAIEVRCKRQ